MKTIIVSMAVAAGLVMAGSAMAVDMPAIGKAKCGACHAIDHKLIGPAWNDVAKKYAGNKDAEKTIIANVTKGMKDDPYWKTKGISGAMPAKGMGATDAEIKTLAGFILGLK
jgi:cytochrome c